MSASSTTASASTQQSAMSNSKAARNSVSDETQPSSMSTKAASQTTKFTCNTCLIGFETTHEQRTHMRDEWHLYNLKRKMADLPRITSGAFDEKLRSTPKPLLLDSPIASQLQSTSTLRTNAASGRDDGQTQTSGDEYAASDSEEAVEAMAPTACMFCNLKSSTISSNLTHMCQSHGLTVPYQDRLNDLESFVLYLSQIITVFHSCLSCGKTKSSIFGLQPHMADKGHCKFTLDEEFLPFYDFESGDEKVAALIPVGIDNLQRTALPRGSLPRQSTQPRSKKAAPSLKSQESESVPDESQASVENIESSSIIRQQQHHRAQPTRAEEVITRSSRNMGLIGVSDQQKRALMAVEKRMMKIESRARNQYQWAVQKSANKQKYFKVSAERYEVFNDWGVHCRECG